MDGGQHRPGAMGMIKSFKAGRVPAFFIFFIYNNDLERLIRKLNERKNGARDRKSNQGRNQDLPAEAGSYRCPRLGSRRDVATLFLTFNPKGKNRKKGKPPGDGIDG